MATLQRKMLISAEAAVVFLLVNLPFVYKLTDSLLPFNLYDHANNCPTNLGLLVHTLVFFLITFLTMPNLGRQTALKLRHSLSGTFIFFLLSSPAYFTMLNKLVGPQVASAAGCPTAWGLLIATVAYFAVLVGLMYLP